jgi:hypothetical protein
MAYQALCRHCTKEIFQHPSGRWFLVRDVASNDYHGRFVCRFTMYNQEPMHHVPMPKGLKGAPRWIEKR